jgi:hypothetical protein
MKQQRKILCVFFLSGFCIAFVQGQQTIPATGGSIGGTGGSVTYSVGQILYSTFSGANGSVVQGVQQPFEISVVTAVAKTEYIKLECLVYPNPTMGAVKLVIESDDYENLKFLLFDMNGMLLQDKKVETRETEISMENLASSVYFLKVIKNNIEVKVFKIVKR